jgi:hypothetical protein
MQLAVQATVSETGQKVTLYIPPLGSSYKSSNSFSDTFRNVYDQVSTILGVKPSVVVITIDNVLLYPAASQYYLFRCLYNRTGLFIKDKMTDLEAPSTASPFHRTDNTLREFTIYKIYSLNFNIGNIPYILYGPESSMKQISFYDSYNLSGNIFFPELETILTDIDEELTHILVILALESILGTISLQRTTDEERIVMRSPFVPSKYKIKAVVGQQMIEGVNTPILKDKEEILFNKKEVPITEAVATLRNYFLTEFNSKKAKITENTLPVWTCNIEGDLSGLTIMYLFSIDPLRAYTLAQRISNANYVNGTERADFKYDSFYDYLEGNITKRLEDLGIPETLFRGTIWPYRTRGGVFLGEMITRPWRDVIEKVYLAKKDFDMVMNPLWMVNKRFYSSNFNSIDYLNENILFSPRPSLASPIVESSLLVKTNHFPNGFNPHKVYKRLQHLYPEFFSSDMAKLRNKVIFAGGAPSICASDYLWEQLLQGKISTDIDLFIVGRGSKERDSTKNSLAELLARRGEIDTDSSISEGKEVKIFPRFKVFNSVMKVEWTRSTPSKEERKISESNLNYKVSSSLDEEKYPPLPPDAVHLALPVQIICTDAKYSMEVLYNFDMTHIQFGLIAGSEPIMFCTPEYLYYTPRSETLLIRNNIRIHRLIKAMKRGFNPVMRMPYTRIIPSGRITYFDDIVFTPNRIATLEPLPALQTIMNRGRRIKASKLWEMCLIDGKIEVACGTPNTDKLTEEGLPIEGKLDMLSAIKKVKLDGRFRNAFDGYIGRSKPTFVLKSDYTTTMSTMSKIYDTIDDPAIRKTFLDEMRIKFVAFSVDSLGSYTLKNVTFSDPIIGVDVTEELVRSIKLRNRDNNNNIRGTVKIMNFTLPVHIAGNKEFKKRSFENNSKRTHESLWSHPRKGYTYCFAKPISNAQKPKAVPFVASPFVVFNYDDIMDVINTTFLTRAYFNQAGEGTFYFRFQMLAYLPDISHINLDMGESPVLEPEMDSAFIYDAVCTYRNWDKDYWVVNQVMKMWYRNPTRYVDAEQADPEYVLEPKKVFELAMMEEKFTIHDRELWQEEEEEKPPNEVKIPEQKSPRRNPTPGEDREASPPRRNPTPGEDEEESDEEEVGNASPIRTPARRVLFPTEVGGVVPEEDEASDSSFEEELPPVRRQTVPVRMGIVQEAPLRASQAREGDAPIRIPSGRGVQVAPRRASPARRPSPVRIPSRGRGPSPVRASPPRRAVSPPQRGVRSPSQREIDELGF